ncbi:MAG: molecular chaperone HtpG [Deltaproteobacteria bacterium]|nr:MAG: molecular chaperone HtpG [Deltaproteobacteria bacterium]
MTETKTETEATTHQFQASVTRVLSLVINSLYSNKEIFLRELISNSSDALDKLRFRGIAEPALLEGEALHVRVSADQGAGTLTISDTGVGMTRAELEENLGTVAHSGSQDFISKLEDAAKDDVNLIGQFGVGFYSAYLVADRVDVVSRAAGTDEAFRWTSDGKESFTIEAAERETRGTDLILHLKEDQKDFLKTWTLQELIKRYSDYVDHAIELEVEKTVGEGEDAKTEKEWERVNAKGALWIRPKSEIKDEEYNEFYHHLTHDWEPPLARRHFKIEGTQLFTGLLFVPSRPPFDLFSPQSNHGVRLHVKRVFIMEDCEELLPKWLRFMRGVIDSEDLPLNVSRELLQDSRLVKTIRKQVVKYALEMVEEVASGDDGDAFWEKYGAVIKEGLHYEPGEVKRLTKVIRWQSTDSEGLTTLPEYVERMKEDQQAIYYATGASRKLLENAPHLEVLAKRGYEVLLMTDPIDQFAVEGLREVDGKPLISAMDSDLKLADEVGDDDKKDDDKKDDDKDAAMGDLIGRFRTVLQEEVEEVRVSSRLVGSPVCLVLPEGGLPPHIERMMRGQNADMPTRKRILEVNPDHALVKNLNKLIEGGKDDEKVDSFVEVLYDQALLAEGSPVEDPTRLVSKLTELLTAAAAQ